NAWWEERICGFFCFPKHGIGQGDFDLADALDDPEPTKKPISDIYPKPKPPYQPQPGHPDSGGTPHPRNPPPRWREEEGHRRGGGGYLNDVDRDDGRYPPRPRPRPPAGGGGGGGGGYPNYDSSGSTYGGDEHSTYGNPQGNTVAKIVSPIVSVVVVTLVGAAATYLNKRRNCFRNSGEPGKI
uniref:Xg glycoprotein (Xg blood group) n=1 Tax=Otolemur garnettii TaxID=30611 RepID=H0XW88_OTOGA